MRLTTHAVVVAAVALIAGAAVAYAAKSKATEYELQTAIPIGTDSSGRNWFLGGFSGLYPAGRGGEELWTLTDRGANDDADRALPDGSGVYCDSKPVGKVIFLPGFVPQLVKIELEHRRIEVERRIPLHDGSLPASGKPNLTFDEAAYTEDADPATKTCLPIPAANGVIDAFGVDTEAVVVDPRDRRFWLSDEYRPSILRVGQDGQILSRLVPADLVAETPADDPATPTLLTATQYAGAVSAAAGTVAVKPVFPAIVNGFRKNRGFEGLAISPDGRWLYTVLQSPMDFITAWNTPASAPWIKPAVPAVTNSDRNAARRSPYIRVFKIDIRNPSAPVVASEWIYLLELGFTGSNPDGIGEADRISEILWIGPDQLLIEERDDERPTRFTNLWRADFSGATNLLDPGNTAAVALGAKASVPTLEMSPAAAVLEPSGPVTPALKAPLLPSEDVDALLAAAGFVNHKIEGIARPGGREGRESDERGSLLVLNDNDFDLDHTVLGTPSIPERAEVFP